MYFCIGLCLKPAKMRQKALISMLNFEKLPGAMFPVTPRTVGRARTHPPPGTVWVRLRLENLTSHHLWTKQIVPAFVDATCNVLDFDNARRHARVDSNHVSVLVDHVLNQLLANWHSITSHPCRRHQHRLSGTSASYAILFIHLLETSS